MSRFFFLFFLLAQFLFQLAFADCDGLTSAEPVHPSIIRNRIITETDLGPLKGMTFKVNPYGDVGAGETIGIHSFNPKSPWAEIRNQQSRQLWLWSGLVLDSNNFLKGHFVFLVDDRTGEIVETLQLY